MNKDVVESTGLFTIAPEQRIAANILSARQLNDAPVEKSAAWHAFLGLVLSVLP